MAEYTFKDVIIDPTSEEARNCVGKEVYFGDSPYGCLESANDHEKCSLGILESIDSNAVYCPFNINDGYCKNHIILKREDCEPKPEYVPFESLDEFLHEYDKIFNNINCDTTEWNVFNRGGTWLKYDDGDTIIYYHVTSMWNGGLVIGNDTESTDWKILLDLYEFLDGRPCGKLAKRKNT